MASLESFVLQFASCLPPLRQPGGIPVLCYHGVHTVHGGIADRYAVTPAMLESHLAALISGGHTALSINDLAQGHGGSVLLSFDDNLPSHVSHALPVLRAAGVGAVFYLSPGELGAPGRLSRQDVDTLISAGMFVGAHGNFHVPAVNLKADEFARDAKTCAVFLRSLGMPLTWAYPGGYLGSYCEYHERILKEEGFATRFTTVEGVCRPSSDRVQGRYVIRRNSSPRYVRAALRGGLQLVALSKRLRAHGKSITAA